MRGRIVKTILIGLLALLGACCITTVIAFAPLYLPCGSRGLTEEERTVARQLYGGDYGDYDEWYIPCGAQDLPLEDRVRVAYIARADKSEFVLFPFVLRLDFDRLCGTPHGGKLYQFKGYTVFFLVWNRIMFTEDGRVPPNGKECDEIIVR